MGEPNVTFSGCLASTEAANREDRPTLLRGPDEVWTDRQVREALDSARAPGFSGRTGVLLNDRLLAGLVSTAVMREATCVPLDPALTTTELDDRLRLLGIQTVVSDDPQWQSPVISSVVRVAEADRKLTWQGKATPGQASDDALVLMTSGSTGRPKIVSLSHCNLIHSVGAIVESLFLTPEDRAVNLLPLSHIGGLVDLFLVPLVSGGSVVFGEARAPDEVLSLLASTGPTWLQAAPAILQGLVRAAPDQPDHQLRLVRSVSAPLSSALFEATSRLFEVPVIEMYGMSETAGVITSNPLPPQQQKLGSVGKAVACEVRIGPDGDVQVRSPGLFRGYAEENDNEGLWEDEWFTSGDLGHLDDDGYLFLTGRRKELINRGGQKVSPAEIDHLVESWEEVREAAAFSIAHPTLGEEVGLALVLREGAALSDQEIRERLARRLADYKLPKRLVRLDKLPRNQNGKLQRFRLAELPPREDPAPVALSSTALSSTAQRILPLWQAALGQKNSGHTGIDPTLDFFDAGGDSLSATSLLVAIEKKFRIPLTGFIFYENATLQDLAAAVEERLGGGSTQDTRDPDFPPRVRDKLNRFLSSWPGKPPFPGSYARLDEHASPEARYFFWCCNGIKELAPIAENARSHLAVVALRSLRAVQHKKLRNDDLITAVYADEVNRLQPEGPLILGGYCEGGRIMVRVARALLTQGREIRLLVLQDHNLEVPFPARVAMIHSRGWKRDPLKLHHDIEKGWARMFEGGFAVMEKDSRHSRVFSPEAQRELRRFLREQVDLAETCPPAPVAPDAGPGQCQVTSLSKLPLVLRCRQAYPLSLQLHNHGSETIRAKDGLVLHARWVDLMGDPKPGFPMFAPLPRDLAPGEKLELVLEIKAHRPKRLYQLQVALLREGRGWTPGVLQNSHRQWRLID